LLFFAPFLSLRQVSLCLMGAILGWVVINMESMKLEEFIGEDFTKHYLVNVATFLCLPTLGFLLLLLSALRKKQVYYWVLIGSALLFIGAFMTVFPFMGLIDRFLDHEHGFPYNYAFFGTQILGVLGAFLLTYVHSLPKKT